MNGTFKAGDTFILDHMYRVTGSGHQLPDNFTLAAVKGGGFDIVDSASSTRALIFLGNGTAEEGGAPGVHTPLYDFNDAAIPYGVAYWVQLVRQELSLPR